MSAPHLLHCMVHNRCCAGCGCRQLAT